MQYLFMIISFLLISSPLLANEDGFTFSWKGYLRTSFDYSGLNDYYGTPIKSKQYENRLLDWNGSGWGNYDCFTSTRIPESNLYELSLTAEKDTIGFNIMFSSEKVTNAQAGSQVEDSGIYQWVRQIYAVVRDVGGINGLDLTFGQFWDKYFHIEEYDRYLFGRIEGTGVKASYSMGASSISLAVKLNPYRSAHDPKYEIMDDYIQTTIISGKGEIDLTSYAPLTLGVYATFPRIGKVNYEHYDPETDFSIIKTTPPHWGFIGGTGLNWKPYDWMEINGGISHRSLLTRTDDGTTIYNKGGKYYAFAFEDKMDFISKRLRLTPFGWIEYRTNLDPQDPLGFGGLYIRGEYKEMGYYPEGSFADFSYWQKGKGLETAETSMGIGLGIIADFMIQDWVGIGLRYDYKDPNTEYTGDEKGVIYPRADDQFSVITPRLFIVLTHPMESLFTLSYSYVTDRNLLSLPNLPPAENTQFIRGQLLIRF